MYSVEQLKQLISKLDAKNIQIIIPASNQEKQKIIKKLGRHPEKLMDDFIWFRDQTGINRFTFTFAGKKQPKGWRKKGQLWTVLNFDKISNQNDVKTTLADLSKKIMEGEREPAVSRAEAVPRVSQKIQVASKIKTEKGKTLIFAEDLLIELGDGVQIFFPDAKRKGIKGYVERNFLELSKEDEKYLFILLREGKDPPEVRIGMQEYRLKESTIVELTDDFEWVDGTLVQKENKGKEFPLMKNGEGVRIINLNEIDNEKIVKFLS